MTALNRTCIVLPIVESSQVGDARRQAVVMAGRLGFGETAQGRVAIVLTELAQNLVKHAQDGELVLQPVEWGGEVGIEVLAIDKGPGIRNVAQCLQDGYSTVGTAGTGLGAIQRQSAQFELYTLPGVGTALMVRLMPTLSSPLEQNWLMVSGINRAKAGEVVSGDTWAVLHQPDYAHLGKPSPRTLILVGDGLGSGLAAAEASQAAVRVMQDNDHLSPKAILQLAHPVLRNTRGAAVSIAAIYPEAGFLQYAGVGNVSGAIVTDGKSRSLVSYNGTIGLQFRKVEEFTYEWSPGSILILSTDGLSNQWSLSSYPGLAARHPTLIAATLYRDFRRSRDDVTILAAKSPLSDDRTPPIGGQDAHPTGI
ncbi:ATP-binding SpoIIE family protein phosphatase [Leptolyngbya ohadii]|uniref:ATP-binding SpoIIE family protein phosphatase n=1 Tax=Leptolyngbya ohadii TaxID=1962290 RepID=UPI000B5A16EF|nr:ATP-binding SpoIIE family protein phosphatase [Leptolyngbya ohadii]